MAPVMPPSAHSTPFACIPPRSRTTSPRLQRKLTDENATQYDEDIATLVARDRSRDKALLIAAQAYPGEQAKLSTPHSDQDALHKFLVNISFNSSNIHCLREDRPDAPQHPTKKNIERELRWLAYDVRAGDFVVLHLAGHATQILCNTGSEEDGWDEAFVTVDVPVPNTRNNLVRDNVLRRLVVNSLPGGSFLLAILDTCSSGTLLDLDSTTKYKQVKWPADKDPESPTLPNRPLLHEPLVRTTSPLQSDRSIHGPRPPSSFLPSLMNSPRSGHPVLPSDTPQTRTDFAYVISIAACDDGERAWAREETMLHHLLRLFNEYNDKPLTPKELEKELDQRMYEVRRRAIEAVLGVTWNNDWEREVRALQKPKITTLPEHKLAGPLIPSHHIRTHCIAVMQILSKPLVVLQSRPKPEHPTLQPEMRFLLALSRQKRGSTM